MFLKFNSNNIKYIVFSPSPSVKGRVNLTKRVYNVYNYRTIYVENTKLKRKHCIWCHGTWRENINITSLWYLVTLAMSVILIAALAFLTLYSQAYPADYHLHGTNCKILHPKDLPLLMLRITDTQFKVELFHICSFSISYLCPMHVFRKGFKNCKRVKFIAISLPPFLFSFEQCLAENNFPKYLIKTFEYSSRADRPGSDTEPFILNIIKQFIYNNDLAGIWTSS